MIVGIKDVYLYTGLTETGGNDCAKAINWLNANNVTFKHLLYGDIAQHDALFEALNTWGIGVFSDFPFVIYDEVHDDYSVVKQALIGLDAIESSNLAELTELGAA